MKGGIILEALREVFFPQGCCLCKKSLDTGIDAFYGLCTGCREVFAVPAAERGRCSSCGKPLISEIGNCLPCRNGQERSFDRLICMYPYDGKYKTLLAAYKFEKRLCLGNFFAEIFYKGLSILDEQLQEDGSSGSIKKEKYCWVPVPPRAGKIKETGWDQISYLAKLMEKTEPMGLKIPIWRCLTRMPSPSQKELNRQDRLHNLKGRIIVKNTVPKNIILFDDVYTTGATMDACAAVLKAQGAEIVYGICLFYD